MTGISLGTGLRALLTSQSVLDTIGHNIANANTPGYTRQRVDLSASLPLLARGLLVGSGVQADRVSRSIDTMLESRILKQVGIRGALQARLGHLREVEAFFAEPDGNGVSQLLDGFFQSVSDLSGDPGDPVRRVGLVQSSSELTSQLHRLASSLHGMRGSIAGEIEGRVESLNRLSEGVAELNVRIGELESTGTPANDLRDERDRLVREMGELADVKVFEQASGALRVLVSGATIVSSAQAHELSLVDQPDGSVTIRIEGAEGDFPSMGGEIGSLLDLSREVLPRLREELDLVTRNFVREVNRIHAVGVPASGPFTSLTGTNRVEDRDLDGSVADELLANAGLPFDVVSGELFVNVTNLETGDVEQHSVSVQATHTTVGGFASDLTAIPHLSAQFDAFGRLQLVAGAGYGFDFAPRLDTAPDAAGTLGGGAASLGGALSGPFALADGDTLTLTSPVGAGAQTVTVAFDAADFADVQNATPEEVAAALNAAPGFASAGLVAEVVDGRVYLQTADTGTGASFQVDGGTAAGALGFAGFVGTPAFGHDVAVDPVVGGAYTGSENDVWTFRPSGDGTVGTTPGLGIDVFDGDGALITTLDVGAGYVPGTPLDVAEGVTVAFGLGGLSATENDAMQLRVIARSDSTDALVALGVNGLFTGSTAEDVEVREDVELDPSLVSTSFSGADGDTGALLELLALGERGVAELGGATIAEAYADVVGGLAFDTSSTESAAGANATLLESLETRRAQLSGVNVDEELVDLLRFEQSFQAAARFIGVVNQLNDSILQLV